MLTQPAIGSDNRALQVVMYHYVRDLPRTRFPRINGMLLDNFRRQVTELSSRYEMATVETALAFMSGEFRPRRDLCLLSFDDGLREHYAEVTPFLADLGIQGVFFVVTGCQENARVAAVHMNHFLTAELGFETYSKLVFEQLESESNAYRVDTAKAARTYPWDRPDVAEFKYLFNFMLAPGVRDEIMGKLFATHLGEEAVFARELYFTWEEAREMQNAGMALGGHTHQHRALAGLSDEELSADLRQCGELLRKRVRDQHLWPFCYPYGKKDSFDGRTQDLLKNLNFNCAFSTETGNNTPGGDMFSLRRFDCNRVPEN